MPAIATCLADQPSITAQSFAFKDILSIDLLALIRNVCGRPSFQLDSPQRSTYYVSITTGKMR
jgi:hypothetical protein